MAKYVEVVPPPAEVDLQFYEPDVGHISVAPLGFVHHEDATIVGTALVGLDKQIEHVHLGDAIITYPDGTVVVKRPDNARAFYAPVPEPELPALPAEGEDSAALDEALGGKRKRK